jgi:hypothetical protein
LPDPGRKRRPGGIWAGLGTEGFEACSLDFDITIENGRD